LSVAAVQLTVTWFQAAAEATTSVGTEGAVTSPPVPSVVVEAALDWADSLPAASIALTR
jgi:hypothetical protein